MDRRRPMARVGAVTVSGASSTLGAGGTSCTSTTRGQNVLAMCSPEPGSTSRSAVAAHVPVPARAGSRPPASGSPLSPWGHPRVRGEQLPLYLDLSVMRGPSPRVRGADGGPSMVGVFERTIPACAGSSSPRVGCVRRRWDHPRVRGEQAGFSQPVRGRVVETIPACAGSRAAASPAGAVPRDHPRVRGEQGCSLRVWREGAGPSPRARGAGHRLTRPRRDCGTIPACAGSSISRTSPTPRGRDHPRVRGEQVARFVWPRPDEGPSPRARGAVMRCDLCSQSVGTIPACAGSSALQRGARIQLWDHPRVRGEQYSHGDWATRTQGPSPRARGAEGATQRISGNGGTIPACAGSSGGCSRCSTYDRDHPRVRGEQTF